MYFRSKLYHCVFFFSGYLRNIWSVLDGIIKVIDQMPGKNEDQERVNSLRFTFDIPERDRDPSPPPPPPPAPGATGLNIDEQWRRMQLLPCV
jgi:hypothetical protein